jgi:hypothetical protein
MCFKKDPLLDLARGTERQAVSVGGRQPSLKSVLWTQNVFVCFFSDPAPTLYLISDPAPAFFSFISFLFSIYIIFNHMLQAAIFPPKGGGESFPVHACTK